MAPALLAQHQPQLLSPSAVSAFTQAVALYWSPCCGFGTPLGLVPMLNCVQPGQGDTSATCALALPACASLVIRTSTLWKPPQFAEGWGAALASSKAR